MPTPTTKLCVFQEPTDPTGASYDVDGRLQREPSNHTTNGEM
jgi:hypothetical protein